jgi:hypothetical protein
MSGTQEFTDASKITGSLWLCHREFLALAFVLLISSAVLLCPYRQGLAFLWPQEAALLLLLHSWIVM